MELKEWVKVAIQHNYNEVLEKMKGGKARPYYFASVLVKASADILHNFTKSIYANQEVDKEALKVNLSEIVICAVDLANYLGEDLTTIVSNVVASYQNEDRK